MTNKTDLSENLPVRTVFDSMDQEYRDRVVDQALSSLESVSSEQQREFQALVRDNITGIQGFRDSSRAPAFVLKQPISQKVLSSNDLACGVLALWIESHPELKEKVEAHLGSAGIPMDVVGLVECRFKGAWSQDACDREVGKFANLYPDFARDDVELMFQCLSGKAVVDMTEEVKNSSGQPAGILDEALTYLKSLPIIAPEWEREVPDFIDAAIQIKEANEAERSLAASLDSTISGIKTGFVELLQFFECDPGSWTTANLQPGVAVREAASLASELESLLTEYQAVHLPAPVMSEERERSLHRARLQEQILETVDRMGEALASPSAAEVAAVALPRREMSQDSHRAPAYEQFPNAESPGIDAANPPESEPDVLANDTGSGAVVAGVSMEEYESVQSLNLTLEQDKERLEQEVKRLESDLYESQKKEESWRTAYYEYDESRKGPDEEIDEDALGMDDVAQAVARATSRFRDRLLFQLNSDSTVEDNPFERPDQVWRALQWLATVYYRSRIGDITVPDFDLSVREACGWWYKPSQGETTMTSYRNSYTTQLDGKTYWLKEHIGKGTNRDARYTIRIAFDWDRERKAVVVGYIGRHQQTDQS